MTEIRRTFTRRPRERKTRWAVRVAETVARAVITIGGVSTILAVATVSVFLVYVALPLFRPAAVLGQVQSSPRWPDVPVQMGMDEDQLMAWGLFRDGTLRLVRLDTGEERERRSLFEGPPLTAWSLPPAGEDAAFGFADGSVRTGRIHFVSRLMESSQLPEALRNLPPGQKAPYQSGMVVRTPQGEVRFQELEVDFKAPAKPTKKSPVRLLDQSKTTTGLVICVFTDDGKLRLNTVREQSNLLTGKVTLKLSGIDLPYTPRPGKGHPKWLFLSAVGDSVYLFWEDGHMVRFDARDGSAAVVAESRNVLGKDAQRVTGVRCLIGKGTYLVGDSSGGVRAWFYANSANARSTDGGQFMCAHQFAGPSGAVSALAVSERSRMAAVGYTDGQVRLLYVTSEKRLADLSTDLDQPVQGLILSPKDDGLLAFAAGKLRGWTFDPRHPEITPTSLFGKVWYEGYDRPQHVWQSSSGTDSFEPKFGLVPLVYGTFKASFYSLLFGVPLALLAAIYTSEFLHPRTKAIVKPTIEMMASLPSVVLGFLAGLVFAQFVEQVVPAMLACLVTVPAGFLGGAYLWQLLPEEWTVRLGRWRFLFLWLVFPVGLFAAAVLGPLLERWFFDGNLRAWLDGGAGGSAGAWTYLLLPAGALATIVWMGQLVNPWLRKKTRRWPRRPAALLSLVKFLAGAVLAVGFAWAAGHILQRFGFDPRGSLVGPYSQRNALVVGFVMAFAIIPIVYTIAEDALSAVPEHLRSGSLAAGATPWQTAVYIVIPTAMSGLFSAVMIGLGRAVGETMIVLMATGNTPVMDWSIFSGFRTLSANIAVELPEAVRDSTHYRTLFLAALVLFAMTFLLNTVAEVIRLRFRRRAYQL